MLLELFRMSNPHSRGPEMTPESLNKHHFIKRIKAVIMLIQNIMPQLSTFMLICISSLEYLDIFLGTVFYSHSVYSF